MMIRLVMAVALLLAVTASPAMAAEAVFEVPINLSNLSPDITRVQVRCSVGGGQISSLRPLSGSTEHAVAGGLINTTVRLLISLPQPGGETYLYDCSLKGYSASLQSWQSFNAAHSLPQFRVTPTPPSFVSGRFVW